MGHCSVFLKLLIPRASVLRGSLDDFRNFYHSFQVSEKRALSTPVGPSWFAREFWNSSALDVLRRRRRPDVDARNSEACRLADAAYKTVGLVTYPKKRVRRAATFKVWGAHVDGDTGLISMDRDKFMALAVIKARLAVHGVAVACERLLQKVAGLWALSMQFRRPLFSLFQELYVTGQSGNAHEPFKLPRLLQQELFLAASLWAFAFSDLKTPVSSELFATDASFSGGHSFMCCERKGGPGAVSPS